MSWNQLLIWPDQLLLSLLVVVIVALPLLWAARRYAHAAFRSLTRLIGGQFRAIARWLTATAQELRRRNREVLLEHGREEVEQHLEREFERVEALVKKDLHGYPAIQRKLSEHLTAIEEDYQKTSEVPPPSPEWTKAVAEISKIKSTGEPVVQRLLADIHDSVSSMHDQALSEYRRAVQDRHGILERARPIWRSLENTLEQVGKRIRGLNERATAIDLHMARYEEILKKSDKAERLLTSSAAVQFAIAAIVMAVAIGGAAINFNLIALPMSEMVGGSSYIGNFRTSDVAALVIILFETSLGLFLMEFLGITHLFSRIRHMNDKLRRRLIWVSFTFLLALAGVEVALAYMRDQIAASNLALRQSLAQTEGEIVVVTSWIPTAGQMMLGFVLPFALAFVAIPLEVLIYSGRTVVGSLLALALNGLAFLCRLIAIFFRQLGELLVSIYDGVISLPLLLEGWIRDRSSPVPEPTSTPPKRRSQPKPSSPSVDAVAREEAAPSPPTGEGAV